MGDSVPQKTLYEALVDVSERTNALIDEVDGEFGLDPEKVQIAKDNILTELLKLETGDSPPDEE